MRAASAAALLLAGCLSSTHVIPRADLLALAREPPEERARHVRVIQGFQNADQPPAAPAVGVETAIVIAPGPSLPVGRPIRSSAKSSADEAKFWIVLAALTAVGLAATEGARYDGWVAMHPMQPVHLYGVDGGYTWVPLAQLDPPTAAWAAKAFVREEEGPPWQHLERAPLDRVGGTYSLLLGGGGLVDTDGTLRPGFVAHIELGIAPIQELVVLLDIGLGIASAPANTLFENRDAIEMQVYPFQGLRPFHPGLYGELGIGWRTEDNPDSRSTTIYAAGGALLQVELTARLALTLRAGVVTEYDQTGAELVGGISIY